MTLCLQIAVMVTRKKYKANIQMGGKREKRYIFISLMGIEKIFIA